MPDATTGRDADLIADLNDLLQLDHDAVEAYTVAIDLARDARYREPLAEYRGDHKRHIEELAALVRARGGLPTELPHPTAPLKLAVQAAGAVPGDATLFLAFKAVEGQVRDKYRRAARRPFPEDVARVVKRAAEDEERHYAWVEQTLRELGVGAGTIPHGAASVVESVHKLLADPLEALERGVMRAVGNVVGTTRSRGGSAAPSPGDAASGAAGAANAAAANAAANAAAAAGDGGATARGDAARFIDALRALEERGDVEGIASLFGDDAVVSNPKDTTPHQGRDGARRFWQAYRDSFEEIRSEFTGVAEGADGVAMLEWTSRGRLAGGAPVTYSGVSVLHLRDGLVRRFRAYFDPAQLQAHAPPQG